MNGYTSTQLQERLFIRINVLRDLINEGELDNINNPSFESQLERMIFLNTELNIVAHQLLKLLKTE